MNLARNGAGRLAPAAGEDVSVSDARGGSLSLSQAKPDGRRDAGSEGHPRFAYAAVELKRNPPALMGAVCCARRPRRGGRTTKRRLADANRQAEDRQEGSRKPQPGCDGRESGAGPIASRRRRYPIHVTL